MKDRLYFCSFREIVLIVLVQLSHYKYIFHLYLDKRIVYIFLENLS